MQESSPVNSPPSHGTSPSLANDALTSPISPVQPNSHSILSKLLKKDENERKPLLNHSHRKSKSYLSTHSHDSLPHTDPESAHDIPPTTQHQQQQDDEHHSYQYASHQYSKKFRPTWKQLKNPKIWMHCLTQPISYIPAVILGLLLNLLDAISYGMITFPLNNPIFASFGPDGISMFFVRFVVVPCERVRQCVVINDLIPLVVSSLSWCIHAVEVRLMAVMEGKQGQNVQMAGTLTLCFFFFFFRQSV